MGTGGVREPSLFGSRLADLDHTADVQIHACELRGEMFSLVF